MLSLRDLIRWISEQFVIDIFRIAHHGLVAELASGFFLPGAPHATGAFGIGNQIADAIGKLHVIPNGDQVAVDAVVDQFGHAADGGCHNGFAEGHRFQNGVGQSLGE